MRKSQETPTALQCRLKQRLVGRVAAYHPIQGHDVGWRDVARHGHEVAEDQIEPIGDATATSLVTSSGEVCLRGLYGGRALGTGRQ